ncbi:hypothetical protein Syun_025725 [Stephania yunnanensis]|uniref:Uncharacterized protein n=1 Tax=Stephania yunnanensis TaxID=152371 RepID=A0AAP0ES74_9MAGN
MEMSHELIEEQKLSNGVQNSKDKVHEQIERELTCIRRNQGKIRRNRAKTYKILVGVVGACVDTEG